jgi:hypothetical protein
LIRSADLPATFDHTLIRLRPRAGVPVAVLELVVSFLNSSHFAQMLAAKGADLGLSVSKLKQVEVPVPSSNVLEALERLSVSEAKYEAWAEQCRDARRSIYRAESYSAAVQRLLAQEQIDFERVQAAEDSQTLDYRIRNDYPHPIALRRQLVRQLDHGKERLDGTLLCAEHAMNLLALAAMVQLSGPDNIAEALPGSSLKAFVRDGKLTMDWGKAEAVVHEGLVHTAKTKDPLSLPFPALVRLTDSADNSFVEAERMLRDVRNRTKHLEEIPPLDLESISRQASEDLETLLEALQVLIVTPLAVVDDYQMDPTMRSRHATFRVLRGISQAFPVEQRQVDREIPRGAVGFLDHAGSFRSLSPWLVMKTCPKCGREETFVFSKYDGKTVKYISMETGHASSDNRAAVVFRRLLAGAATP